MIFVAKLECMLLLRIWHFYNERYTKTWFGQTFTQALLRTTGAHTQKEEQCISRTEKTYKNRQSSMYYVEVQESFVWLLNLNISFSWTFLKANIQYGCPAFCCELMVRLLSLGVVMKMYKKCMYTYVHSFTFECTK